MTFSTRAKSSTQTRRWTWIHLLSYAHSCSTRATANTQTRLRKRASTPSSRSDAPMDWLTASGNRQIPLHLLVLAEQLSGSRDPFHISHLLFGYCAV